MSLLPKTTLYYGFVCFAMLASCGGGSSGGGGGNGGSSATLQGYISASRLVDVDKDGDLDLLADACCEQSAAIPLFLNDGSGNFTRMAGSLPNRYLGSLGQSLAIEPGDFNGDGNIDLLIPSQDLDYTKGKLQLFYGNGDGTFTDASDKITGGTFDDPLGVVRVADFDGDARLDFLIVPFSIGSINGGIYLQDNNGDFARVIDLEQISPFGISGWYENANTWVGDINNDGMPDIVTSRIENDNYHSSEEYLPWNNYLNTSTPGNLSFTPVENSENEIDWREKNVGQLVDINGDGYLDFLAANGISGGGSIPTSLLIYINDGTGKFNYDVTQLNGLSPGFEHAVFDFNIADFDQDGRDDVFIPDHGFDVAPFPGQRNWLLLNKSSGIEDHTATGLSLAKTFTHGASAGDVNGDGYPDLFLNDSNDDIEARFEGRLWLNNGNATFTESNSGL